MAMRERDVKPVQYRLPGWATDFVDRRAEELHATKSNVVLEALECLRERELAALMAEGYGELADDMLSSAESALAAASETIPEW